MYSIRRKLTKEFRISGSALWQGQNTAGMLVVMRSSWEGMKKVTRKYDAKVEAASANTAAENSFIFYADVKVRRSRETGESF